ncbi:transcription/translation regulatory transformer protein RfaH [Kangiella marina]|uniref:Transcription antitermination protein RfaH n=1 Tax=Kangiella marina TaxID=1079178 RepID=A0ABP8INU0_9GAMM
MSDKDKSEATAWYLVHCKPRQELRAEENLENQSINSFLPLMSIDKVVRGKRQMVEEVMFPGYLFVELPLSGELWAKIRSTRGIRDFVRFGGKPARISLELLEQLKVLETNLVTNTDVGTPKEGDRVRILRGPFKDLEGVFQMADGERRSIVLLNILGKESKLELLNKDIEKT